MSAVCFYFQVHQPYRVGRFSYFDSCKSDKYFDVDKNAAIARKVADKCYLPTNQVMLELIDRYEGKFKIAYSISGVALEQFQEYTPEVLYSFQDLVRTGCVELIGETYYHSLAAVMNAQEFFDQVKLHTELLEDLFGVTPRVFRNTELIYDDYIGGLVSQLGYKGMIAEGCDDILGWRSPNFLYHVAQHPEVKLLLKNYRLSDDIAFRFSNQGWGEWPLTADKFASWVHQVSGCGDVVNLFMDYETFGEHQWESTGIFEFLRHLPEAVLRHPDWTFMTPIECVESFPARDQVNFFRTTSWADIDRDLTAWRGNRMQEGALQRAFGLRDRVVATGDKLLMHDWRKLLTSDHFYYMCTKWAADGDVHAYFSPFDSPYDAFIYFMNAFRAFERKLELHELAQDKKQSAKASTAVVRDDFQADSARGL
ncbi:MAG: glycoside hydrolase family 57 protein [Bdellovibrionales bacterium]|nr:glycoside hydrolase family 57 protein [Bdellovibrionales bacterium]